MASAGFAWASGREWNDEAGLRLLGDRCRALASDAALFSHRVAQEMQDALTSSEGERNALKRQLAKLSKKYQQVGCWHLWTATAALDPAIVSRSAGGARMLARLESAFR